MPSPPSANATIKILIRIPETENNRWHHVLSAETTVSGNAKHIVPDGHGLRVHKKFSTGDGHVRTWDRVLEIRKPIEFQVSLSANDVEPITFSAVMKPLPKKNKTYTRIIQHGVMYVQQRYIAQSGITEISFVTIKLSRSENIRDAVFVPWWKKVLQSEVQKLDILLARERQIFLGFTAARWKLLDELYDLATSHSERTRIAEQKYKE